MLIHSTLSNLPIYFMSLFTIPRTMSLRIEKIQRDFLWGGRAFDNKPHLEKWLVICKVQEKDGLGVLSFSLLNKGLLL